MIDPKMLREDPDALRAAAREKNVTVDVDALVALDVRRRELLGEFEACRAKQKRAGEGIAKASGDEKQGLIAAMKEVADRVKELSAALEEVQAELDAGLALVPNPPLAEVPRGASEEDNVVLRCVPEVVPELPFEPRDYMDIAALCRLIDVERAGKVSGTRFGYILRELALMEFAVVRYALEKLSSEGFVPAVPPVMIREEAMAAMGYMARGAEEIYRTQDDLFLVGTSEQSMGPFHMDEMLDASELPLRYCAFSTCFRREAGSYGKDTRGILRVHQFDKVEMFVFCKPDQSRDEHKLLLRMEEDLVRGLGIPYRVLDICTADLGDPAAAKFDVECWMPGQGAYRETHSTSNCTDYQARSLGVRYRPQAQAPPEYVHTLNGTAFAVGRILIAILENYQREDGGVTVPEALRPHMGGLASIEPRVTVA